MIILGLTGSIGMGKSETSKMFRRLGVPVFDADATVHDLMSRGGRAVAAVAAAFPGAVKDGAVDRVALGAQVFGKPDQLRRLEGILHPRVGALQRRFLMQSARQRLSMVVLDIPLLFEGRGEEHCDVTAVVSAPAAIQRQRVLARPNMTEEKFRHILKQQVADVVKRQRADFILPTGLGKHYTLRYIKNLITICGDKRGQVWPPHKRPFKRPSQHPSRRPVHARNRIRH